MKFGDGNMKSYRYASGKIASRYEKVINIHI